jgi:hypothetical protein
MASASSVQKSTPAPRWFVLGLFAIALLVNGWALSRYWNESLRDAHEFRQLQTALSTYYLKQDGWRLAYETPVLGPPWSIPLEFPTYEAVVAGLSGATGLPLEQSGRAVSVFFFYAGLPAVWLLLRRRLPDPGGLPVVLAAILVCPVYLFYSRTFMIESTALGLSLWFLQFLDTTLNRRSRWALPAVALTGALAALTKVTTFAAFWIAGAALLTECILARRRAGASWREALQGPVILALLAVAGPLLAGSAWVLYSDHLKELNSYGHLITSAQLRSFNLGTLAQRASYEWWRAIGYITTHQVLVVPGLIVLGLGLWLSAAPYRRLALACLLCYPGGCLLFANLYYVHDYYFYASAVFLLAALGVASIGLLHSPRVPRLAAGFLVVAALAFEVQAFGSSYYDFYRRPNPPIPSEAPLIRAVTPPADVIAGFGFDWNSLLPYYTERRGLFPFNSHTGDFDRLDRSLAGLGSRRVATLLVAHRHRDDRNFTDILIGKLQMCAKPIARTGDMDIYVRRDLAAAAVRALSVRKDWKAELNLKPADNVILLEERHELDGLGWLKELRAFSPLPFQSRGKYEINYMDSDSGRLIFTQAPTEIRFHPPAGSRSIEAVGGMLPAAYTPPNRTPGVLVEVFEEMPDGTRRVLFERLLMPLTQPADRGDVAISYRQDEPFTGTLVFAHYPVPSGDISYAWSCWKRIIIR